MGGGGGGEIPIREEAQERRCKGLGARNGCIRWGGHWSREGRGCRAGGRVTVTKALAFSQL